MDLFFKRSKNNGRGLSKKTVYARHIKRPIQTSITAEALITFAELIFS
jgi:hypothetical protein